MALALQDAFDLIWERAKTPVRAEHNGRCMYRLPCGSRSRPETVCLAGAVIHDDVYRPEFDGNDYYLGLILSDLGYIDDFDVNDFLSIGRWPLLDLCNMARHIHDAHDPITWPDELRKLAARHALTIPN